MAGEKSNQIPPVDRFDEDPERSYTLPAAYYTDPAIFEREKEAIFFRSWQLVGHTSRLRNPGDYFTCRIFDQNLFVIRGRDDALRAFHNVCQHRAHRLLDDSGNRKRIVCPYHAWTYDPEGRLRDAPNRRNVPGFNRDEISLSPLQVEGFCGFVFVNLDSDAPSLKSQTGAFEDEIRSFAPNCEKLVHAHRVEYQVRANWKVCAENFSECYHCRLIHPKLSTEFIDMDGYRVATHGIYQRHHIKMQESVVPSVDYARGDNAPQREQASWSLWPHMAFQVAHGGYLTAFRWIPVDPDHTIFCEDWYLPDATPTEDEWALIRFRAEYTQPEDDSVCEAVQEGLHSRGYHQGAG